MKIFLNEWCDTSIMEDRFSYFANGQHSCKKENTVVW